VTGGGHGIGRIICLAFAGIGARVVVAELDGAAGGAVADECAALGTDAIAIATDVGDEASVTRMADRVAERFGGADVLVNNAAIFATVAIAHDRLEALDAGEWDRVMAVNLRGPFLCARALVPQMRARRAGRIVNISSGTARHGGGAPIHYIASPRAASDRREVSGACGRSWSCDPPSWGSLPPFVDRRAAGTVGCRFP